MSQKNILSVVPVDGGWAVAQDKKPTGLVFTNKQDAVDEKKRLMEARKPEAVKPAKSKTNPSQDDNEQ